MGLLDDLKNKAQDIAEEHGDKIKQGLEKAGEFADAKTKGKHADKVEQGVEKAKGLVDRLAHAEGTPKAEETGKTEETAPPPGDDKADGPA